MLLTYKEESWQESLTIIVQVVGYFKTCQKFQILVWPLWQGLNIKLETQDFIFPALSYSYYLEVCFCFNCLHLYEAISLLVGDFYTCKILFYIFLVESS